MLQNQTKKSSTGFTLIELIIVIVILGILAVTAAPRFINITGDARESVLNGLAGSLKSAAALQHDVAIINQGNVGLRGTATGLENGYISRDDILFDRGYPVALDFDNPGDSLTGTGPDLTPEILEAMEVDLEDWTFNYEPQDSEDGLTTRGLYITSRDVIATPATAAQIIATGCYVSYESFLTVERAPAVKVFANGCS